MSQTPTIDKIPHLEQYGNVVPEGYSYYEKIFTPGNDLVHPGAYLKWYNLYPSDAPITPEQETDASTFLAGEVERLKFAGDLGFVIFHRAGNYLLLMMMSWRNTNEIWESVYFKEVDSSEVYQQTTFDTAHRGTYCVWELGAVWHERHAWVRFLSSGRDNAAKLAYINDRFEGRV
jgi:hypothetical protein